MRKSGAVALRWLLRVETCLIECPSVRCKYLVCVICREAKAKPVYDLLCNRVVQEEYDAVGMLARSVYLYREPGARDDECSVRDAACIIDFFQITPQSVLDPAIRVRSHVMVTRQSSG